jgi:hypothetical protein
MATGKSLKELWERYLLPPLPVCSGTGTAFLTTSATINSSVSNQLRGVSAFAPIFQSKVYRVVTILAPSSKGHLICKPSQPLHWTRHNLALSQ